MYRRRKMLFVITDIDHKKVPIYKAAPTQGAFFCPYLRKQSYIFKKFPLRGWVPLSCQPRRVGGVPLVSNHMQQYSYGWVLQEITYCGTALFLCAYRAGGYAGQLPGLSARCTQATYLQRLATGAVADTLMPLPLPVWPVQLGRPASLLHSYNPEKKYYLKITHLNNNLLIIDMKKKFTHIRKAWKWLTRNHKSIIDIVRVIDMLRDWFS